MNPPKININHLSQVPIINMIFTLQCINICREYVTFHRGWHGFWLICIHFHPIFMKASIQWLWKPPLHYSLKDQGHDWRKMTIKVQMIFTKLEGLRDQGNGGG